MQAIDFVIGADQDITDFVDAGKVIDVDYLTATDVLDSADTGTQVGGIAVLADDAAVPTDGSIFHVEFQKWNNQGQLPQGFAWDDDLGTIVEDDRWS